MVVALGGELMLLRYFRSARAAVLFSWTCAYLTSGPALAADSAQSGPPAQSCPPTQSCPAKPSPASAPAATQTPFEFEYFEELMAPVEDWKDERLCGLDKVCMVLWKKGKLQIYREGRIYTGDYNLDGMPDEALILEKDDPDDPTIKEFYVSITSAEKGRRKCLLHQLIPNANNILSVDWDPEKKALIIDTGGRVTKTPMITTYGTGAIYGNTQVIKLIVVVVWNPRTRKFDVLTPGFGKGK
jgi:hypothetical protein